MHRSKPFSTVLFSSFLTITALTTVPQLTGENRAVAQNNTQPTKNSVEKKCTDKDVLALYKAVNELNIRVNVGLNYTDFTKYYTDLEILKSSINDTENCIKPFRIMKKIISGYSIIRSLWKYSMVDGGAFFPATHDLVKQLGDVSNSLKQYPINDIVYVSTEALEKLYMQENLKDFERVKELI